MKLAIVGGNKEIGNRDKTRARTAGPGEKRRTEETGSEAADISHQDPGRLQGIQVTAKKTLVKTLKCMEGERITSSLLVFHPFSTKKVLIYFVQYEIMLCSVRVTYVVGLDYRVRKLHRKTLDERREERAKNWEEERVKEVEEEIQRQKEEDR